jgi:hypothetical protein
MCPADTTKLRELNFALNFFSIFTTPVIGGLTGGAVKFYELVLGHIYKAPPEYLKRR